MADPIPVRVLIVDDHPVVRAGLRGMLATEPEITVAGEAADGLAAVAVAAALRPDVVLMDLRMPRLDGVGATARIRAETPGVHVLVLTTYDSDADILRAIEAGATGYLLKDAPREELLGAIRAAAVGRPTLAPAVTARLLARIRSPTTEPPSARELEVLRLVARGRSNREIGRELRISEATVKSHLIHLFQKLGVGDRTAAVTTALERGLITLD
ncbi:MAG: response regulator transcription factor [Chloroflexia bacterium]|nr:response regulator transcription factor [Chloroflexia bacterium]